MNKVILGLILAVCILGMALVMLNETWQKNDYSPPPMAENPVFHRIPVWCRKKWIFQHQPKPTKSSREIAEKM